MRAIRRYHRKANCHRFQDNIPKAFKTGRKNERISAFQLALNIALKAFKKNMLRDLHLLGKGY